MKKTAIIIAALAISVSVLFGVASGSYDDEFQKAVDEYKMGNYEEAASILEQYVKERPEGRAYYLLGYANYALGKDNEATTNFQDAYLVAPEMSPQDFRKAIGIDLGPPIEPGVMNRPFITTTAPKKKRPAPAAPRVPTEPPAPVPPPAPEVKRPAPVTPTIPTEPPAPISPAAPEVGEPAPTPAPAVKAPAERPPAEEAPAPRPRRRPTPAPAKPAEPAVTDKAIELITSLGIIPLATGAAIYLFYCLSIFIIGRRTDTGASWLAFVPGINLVWPVVGAANKSKIWILLSLLIWPLVWLYMWMLIAARFGRSKVLGLLYAFIVYIPLLNILFAILLFKKGGGAGTGASMGFELPEFPEGMPELPEVPGMEEMGEETSFESGGKPEGWGASEESFADVMEEAKEAPAEEAFEFGEETPAEEAFGFGEGTPAEEAFEEAVAEEAFEEVTVEEAFEEAPEEAAPHKGAESWEFPEEEPLEYESAEGEEEFAGLMPMGAGAGLMGIGELFSKTFDVFKKRALLLIGLCFFAVLITGIVVGIFVGVAALMTAMMEGMRKGIAIGSGIVAGIAGLIAFGWGYGAFIQAVADESLGFGAALRRSWQKVGSFIWIFLLFSIIPVGGLGLFIFPGILFWVWFSLALFVFAKEGVTGMGALLKSKEYVKGHFGGVFLRLFLIFIIAIGISWLFAAISYKSGIRWLSIVDDILSLLYTPFMMLFIYNIYADLRGLKGKFAFTPSGGQKALYPVLGILGLFVGLILIVLVTTLLFGVALFGGMIPNMQF